MAPEKLSFVTDNQTFRLVTLLRSPQLVSVYYAVVGYASMRLNAQSDHVALRLGISLAITPITKKSNPKKLSRKISW